ncbi:MAG: tetratricopeptide repeat protein [Kofleriaceae bacterium]
MSLALMVACGTAPAHPRPDADVRAELELAERAELARDHLTARRHYDAAIAKAIARADRAAERFVRRELAETLLTWGELGEARAQLEAVVAIAPRDAASWHDLGIVRHGAGDVSGAVVALSTAARLAPEDPRPRIALAALYWRHGRHAEARRAYEELLRLELPPRVREKVRWALQRLQAPSPP